MLGSHKELPRLNKAFSVSVLLEHCFQLLSIGETPQDVSARRTRRMLQHGSVPLKGQNCRQGHVAGLKDAVADQLSGLGLERVVAGTVVLDEQGDQLALRCTTLRSIQPTPIDLFLQLIEGPVRVVN